MSSQGRKWEVGDLCTLLVDGKRFEVQRIDFISNAGIVRTSSAVWGGDSSTCGHKTRELLEPTASEIVETADASRENFAEAKREYGETIKGLAKAYTEAVQREQGQEEQT